MYSLTQKNVYKKFISFSSKNPIYACFFSPFRVDELIVSSVFLLISILNNYIIPLVSALHLVRTNNTVWANFSVQMLHCVPRAIPDF